MEDRSAAQLRGHRRWWRESLRRVHDGHQEHFPHGATHRSFSSAEARDIGVRIVIDWTSSWFDVEQFRMGLGVELEHGRHDPATNVTDDDELTTGRIAWAHLSEFPDYYTRLAKMEAEAERYWAEGGAS